MAIICYSFLFSAFSFLKTKMPLYTCRVATLDGKIIVHKQVAENDILLREELKRKGYYILSIKKKSSFLSIQSLNNKNLNFISNLSGIGKLSSTDFLIFNQEFLALIKAGVPILRALELLENRIENKTLQKILQKAIVDVKSGDTLSRSLSAFSVVPSLYIASLEAGERSGNLEQTLSRYIEHLKIVSAIRRRVISALSYPVVLGLVAIAVIIFLLSYVVPTFAEVYGDFNAKLPIATRILIEITTFIKTQILWLIFTLLCFVIVFYFFSRTEKGSFLLDTLKLRLPLIGTILQKYLLSYFARSFATVLGGGVSVPKALEIALGSINNRLLVYKLKKTISFIKEGKTLAESLSFLEYSFTKDSDRVNLYKKESKKSTLIPSIFIEMIAVGEKTGSLEDMLSNIAELYEQELEHEINILVGSIEPLLIVSMGLIVGSILILMYLPIFHLAGAVR